jgi:uncharacterized protein
MLIGMNEKCLLDKKKSKVVFEIEKLAEANSPYFGKPHFAGLPHMRVVIGKRIVNEMYIFLALSIFASSILLYLFPFAYVLLFSVILLYLFQLFGL